MSLQKNAIKSYPMASALRVILYIVAALFGFVGLVSFFEGRDGPERAFYFIMGALSLLSVGEVLHLLQGIASNTAHMLLLTTTSSPRQIDEEGDTVARLMSKDEIEVG